MKTLIRIYPVAIAAAFAALIVVGCGKKEAVVEAPPAEEAPAEVAAAPTDGGGLPEPAPMQGDLTDNMTQMDQALAQRNYEAAAQAMLQVQLSNQRLTEQQGFDQVNRMRELSRQIAEASASGDPRAMRAAEMMRRIHAAQTAR